MNPLESTVFEIINSQSHIALFLHDVPYKRHFPIFSIPVHRRPKLIVPYQQSVVIYINLVELYSPMQYPKLQSHGSGDEEFTIYEHGGHSGHVTTTIYINFRSLSYGCST